jgi:hypothetical protein
MAKPRVIILAAGDGERWKNFRGTPKHLTKVENKVLLERTCEQFLKYTDDVCVIGLDNRYQVEGTSLYVIKAQNTHWKDASKFLSSKNLWLRDGRTILVFGDVYFTSEAVKTIMKNNDPFKFFLRTGPNEQTGARWKEIFALSFDQTMAPKIGQNLLYLTSRGQVDIQAGWALYRYMIGTTANGLFNNPYFIEINDWTEDFDFPEDLEIWEAHRARRAENAAKLA